MHIIEFEMLYKKLIKHHVPNLNRANEANVPKNAITAHLN